MDSGRLELIVEFWEFSANCSAGDVEPRWIAFELSKFYFFSGMDWYCSILVCTPYAEYNKQYTLYIIHHFAVLECQSRPVQPLKHTCKLPHMQYYSVRIGSCVAALSHNRLYHFYNAEPSLFLFYTSILLHRVWKCCNRMKKPINPQFA